MNMMTNPEIWGYTIFPYRERLVRNPVAKRAMNYLSILFEGSCDVWSIWDVWDINATRAPQLSSLVIFFIPLTIVKYTYMLHIYLDIQKLHFFGLDWKVVSDPKSNNCWFCPLSVTFGRTKNITQNDAEKTRKTNFLTPKLCHWIHHS